MNKLDENLELFWTCFAKGAGYSFGIFLMLAIVACGVAVGR